MRNQRGFALPAALFMILAITAVTAALSNMSQENFKMTTVQESAILTNMVAEGAINKMISDMGLYASLWDQQAPLSVKPAGYTEYEPTAHAGTNGIPPCTGGASCHRSMYPAGGGLIKNFGPLMTDGKLVDDAYAVTDQLDIENPPAFDVKLGGLDGWVQVERLDEQGPDASTVGGNLSSSIAEGGNAKKIRFRVNGVAAKSLNQRTGTSTLVTIVLLPVS